MFHEPLDVGLSRARSVAELFGDRQLKLERQPLLGASCEKMQVTADRPEKLFAALEQPELVLGEKAGADELLDVLHAVDIFGDPEQRVEIAKSALALLDVGLDQITRFALPLHAFVAFGK